MCRPAAAIRLRSSIQLQPAANRQHTILADFGRPPRTTPAGTIGPSHSCIAPAVAQSGCVRIDPASDRIHQGPGRPRPSSVCPSRRLAAAATRHGSSQASLARSPIPIRSHTVRSQEMAVIRPRLSDASGHEVHRSRSAGSAGRRVHARHACRRLAPALRARDGGTYCPRPRRGSVGGAAQSPRRRTLHADDWTFAAGQRLGPHPHWRPLFIRGEARSGGLSESPFSGAVSNPSPRSSCCRGCSPGWRRRRLRYSRPSPSDRPARSD